jgi:hypothetical protein
MGFCDASSFGHLYIGEAPVEVRILSATMGADSRLRLTGAVSPEQDFALDLADPCDTRTPVRVRREGTQWEAEIRLKDTPFGRYRLYPVVPDKPVDPHFLHFDFSPASARRSFRLGMTYDIPDNFCANYYTPDRLGDEMHRYADWGIHRIYWIDYGADSPFWRLSPKYAAPSFKAFGGDLLPVAVEKAHDAGMEIFGLFKLWDMGVNRYVDGLAESREVSDMDGKPWLAMPELVAHQDWTMQAHPAWAKQASFPVAELTLFSESPIRRIKPSDLQILISRGNERYKSYRGRFTIRQGVVQRPHYRWTPAGKVPEPGTVKNWFLTLSGLDIRTPYLALRMGPRPFSVANTAFTLAEARSAGGSEVPLTFSLRGDAANGFSFGKDGGGWANTSEGLLNKVTWSTGLLGVTFQAGRKMPTLLEPSFEGARNIWLNRIRRILDGGADGVDIRLLCHHNGCSEWLRYAFAEPVRAEFRRRFGRDVEPNEADYENVRRIRGEFLTEFLRAAKRLTAARGRKLAVHFEARIEVPPHLDTAMQIHWDCETWLNEGIMDELTLKYWSAESVFVHEKVLPLARRKGIPVSVENQVIDVRSDVRGVEKAERIIREGWSAGFAGSVFYEAWGFLMQNTEGRTTPRGMGEAVVKKAAATLALLKA